MTKEKITKIIIIILIIVVILLTFAFAISLNKYKKEKQAVEDSYNRALYDFVSSINNIDSEILKLKISNNTLYDITAFCTVFAHANSAKSDLEVLPVQAQNTSKFLNQLSDFSYSVVRGLVNGEDKSKYIDNINKMYESVSSLLDVSKKVYSDLNNGNIKWDEVVKNSVNEMDKSVDSNIFNIEKTFMEYEGIIYDGAFSNHETNIYPKLQGEEITVEDAILKLKNIFNTENVKYIDEINNKIELYVFDIDGKAMYLTKKGGYIYQMIYDRSVDTKNITIDNAKENALNYLKLFGIENLVPTYYLENNNMVTISFANIEDNVVMYPDLIKVKVALDNGQIMMVEANGYIFNHENRDIKYSKSIKEAKDTLSKDIVVENSRMCYIPTDYNTEILCYEFLCTLDDRKFLIYINANNLVQEKIYILLETEGGTLAK